MLSDYWITALDDPHRDKGKMENKTFSTLPIILLFFPVHYSP
jgi:hypothetical protein